MGHIQRTIIRNLIPAAVLFAITDAMAIEHNLPGPLRLWGELSATYRQREAGASEHRNSNLLKTGTIAASSYIWRPWFALASGSLSLSVDESEADERPDSEDQFTTGDLEFSLFPTSRFPFQAFFIESRDEFDSESFSRDVSTTEYGLSQQYRTLNGQHNYRAEYENRRREQADLNEFLSNSLSLSGDNRLGNHALETNLKLETVDNSTLDENAASQTLSVDHEYDGMANLTVDNLLSTSTTESELTNSSDEFEINQLSSFLTWHPDERKDIRLTGSLRVSESISREQRSNSGLIEFVDNEIVSSNLNQGLIYEVTDNFQLSESINANLVETNGEPIFIANESLAARYSPERRVTAYGDYGWSASGTYNNQHGDVPSTQSFETQLGHSLTNDYSKSDAYRLRGDLTQSLTYLSESDASDEKSVDHSYSLTWSNGASRNQNLLRLFISDSRELDQDEDFFRLLNIQYTGSTRISRQAQFSGNLTLQRTEQRQGGLRSRERVNNGQLEYRHNRLWQVVGLSFVSELQLSKRQSDVERLIQEQDPDTEVSWMNAFLYRIGRLEVQMDFDFVRVEGEYDRLFKFQLTRSFGDL